MKTDALSKVVKAINFSVKVDSNSTNTTDAFQPKLPRLICIITAYLL